MRRHLSLTTLLLWVYLLSATSPAFAQYEPAQLEEPYPTREGARLAYKPIHISLDTFLPRSWSTGSDLITQKSVIEFGVRGRAIVPLSIRSSWAMGGVVSYVFGLPELQAEDLGLEVWRLMGPRFGPEVGEGIALSFGVGVSAREKRKNQVVVDSLGAGTWIGSTMVYGIPLERFRLQISLTGMTRIFVGSRAGTTRVSSLDLGFGFCF